MKEIKFTGICVLSEDISLITARLSFYVFLLTVFCDILWEISDVLRSIGLLSIYGLLGVPVCFALTFIRKGIEDETGNKKPLFVFNEGNLLIYTGVNTALSDISKNIYDVFITSIENLLRRGAIEIKYDKISEVDIVNKSIKFKTSWNSLLFSIYLKDYTDEEINKLIQELKNHKIEIKNTNPVSDNIESKSGKITIRDKSLTFTNPKKSNSDFMLPYKNISYAILTADRILYFCGTKTPVLQQADISDFSHKELQMLLDKLNQKIPLITDWKIVESEQIHLSKSQYTISDDEILEKEVKFGRTEGFIKTYYDNGQLKSESPYKDGNIDGICKEYYQSGAIKSEIEFNKGIQGNLSKTYYESGKLRSELLDGKTAKSKIVKEYYENGSLERETYYNGGKLNGTAIWYYENGNIKESISLKNDKTVGHYKAFYIDGMPEKDLNFIDGTFLFGELSIDKRNNKIFMEHLLPKDRKIIYINNSNTPIPIGKMDGVQKWYYENGILKAEQMYKNDKIDGYDKEFYDNQQLKSIKFYVNGIQNGKAEKYYENGKLKQETEYKDDYPVGIDKEYYDNGSIKRETLYKNKKKNGMEKHYYETGELQYEGEFVNGKLDGIVKEYYKNGKIKSKEYYNNGILKDVNSTNNQTISAPQLSNNNISSQSSSNTNTEIMSSGRRRNIITQTPSSNNNADTDNRNIDL